MTTQTRCKKQQQILWFCCLICFILSSCSFDERVIPSHDTEGNTGLAIIFGIEETELRSSLFDINNLDTVGVFGYYTGAERWDWLSVNAQQTLLPDYFCNKQMVKSGGIWSYDPPQKYWPNDPDSKISFFAYAPYIAADANGNILTPGMLTPYPLTKADFGIPSVTYVVPLRQEDQIDLLWSAMWDMTKANSNGTVLFAMNHALTQISFSAALDTSEIGKKKDYRAKVIDISITGVHGNGILDLSTGYWTPYTNSGDSLAQYTLSLDSGDINDCEFDADTDNGSPQVLSKTDEHWLLIPQVFTAKSMINFTVRIYLKNTPVPPEPTPPLPITIPEPGDPDIPAFYDVPVSLPLASIYPEWKAGRNIDYKLIIKSRR
jgi:hypothetical protein